MENKNNVVHLHSRVVPVMSSWLANPIWLGKRRFESCQLYFNTKNMETKLYQTAKEFFKFLNNYEADIWIRGSRAYNVNGELIAEYNRVAKPSF